MRPIAASGREKQKRDPMPCASRTWRGFSTRHPWRDEKASAPASPPAGPNPPCPAMLGALKGGFTATATATSKATTKPPRFARRQFCCRYSFVDTALGRPPPPQPSPASGGWSGFGFRFWLLPLPLLSRWLLHLPPIAWRRASQRSEGATGMDAGRAMPGQGWPVSAVPRRAREAQGIDSRRCFTRVDDMPGALPLVTFLGRQGK